jgi:hypothetical protein
VKTQATKSALSSSVKSADTQSKPPLVKAASVARSGVNSYHQAYDAKKDATNLQRNRLVRQAILHAAEGLLCMQVDTPNDDVRTALEAIGFRIGSKLEDLAKLDQGLVEFWQGHESSINGYDDLSDRIVTLQEFVRLLLLSDAPSKTPSHTIDQIIDLIFSGYHQDTRQGDLAGLHRRILHLQTLEERFDFAKDYGLNPYESTLSVLALIEDATVSCEARKLIGSGVALVQKVDFVDLLRMGNEIIQAIDNVDEAKVTKPETLAALEVDAAASIRSSLEGLLSNDWSLSWWSFPYIEGQKAWRFCQGLWWLASSKGQLTMASLSKQVTTAAKRGLNETEFYASSVGDDTILMNVVKHYLRLEGYRVTPLFVDDELHTLHIAWE